MLSSNGSYLKGKFTKLLYSFNVSIFFLLGVASYFSPLRSFVAFNQLWAILAFTWFLTISLVYPAFWFKNSLYKTVAYAYLCYTIFVCIVSDNLIIANRYFELFQIPLFYIAFNTYLKLKKEKTLYNLIIWQVPFILFVSISTIRACLNNPMASRMLSSDVDTQNLLLAGVGGYEFIYFLVITIGVGLFAVGNLILTRLQKIGLSLLLLVAIGALIFSNFMTALLLTFFSVFSRLFLAKLSFAKSVIIFAIGSVFAINFESFLIELFDLAVSFSVDMRT